MQSSRTAAAISSTWISRRAGISTDSRIASGTGGSWIASATGVRADHRCMTVHSLGTPARPDVPHRPAIPPPPPAWESAPGPWDRFEPSGLPDRQRPTTAPGQPTLMELLRQRKVVWITLSVVIALFVAPLAGGLI